MIRPEGPRIINSNATFTHIAQPSGGKTTAAAGSDVGRHSNR